ncbi:unnamed protein product [Ectocarpus sp. 8 AP-2014]
MRCSKQVSVSGSTSSWVTYPETPRTSAAVTALPLIRTAPVTRPPLFFFPRRRIRPAKTFKRVVFPAPEGPMMAVTLPDHAGAAAEGEAFPLLAAVPGPANPETPFKMAAAAGAPPLPPPGRGTPMSSHDSRIGWTMSPPLLRPPPLADSDDAPLPPPLPPPPLGGTP